MKRSLITIKFMTWDHMMRLFTEDNKKYNMGSLISITKDVIPNLKIDELLYFPVPKRTKDKGIQVGAGKEKNTKGHPGKEVKLCQA